MPSSALLCLAVQEEEDERERDIHGNVFKTAAELKAEEQAKRAAGKGGVRRSACTTAGPPRTRPRQATRAALELLLLWPPASPRHPP